MNHVPDLTTLVLNADMQPLSWGPLSLWHWQDALVAVLQERVSQVATYDHEVRSVTHTFKVPSVVALKKYHKRKRVSFTRYHVFVRDSFRCQYCGQAYEPKDLTFDHVIPRSKGGLTNWNNVVTACQRDNLLKGDKTLKAAGLHLLRQPYQPTPQQLDACARRLQRKDDLHATWLDYLYWDSALEE